MTLLRIYLTPDGHAAVSESARSLEMKGQRATAEPDPAANDDAETLQEGVSRERLNPWSVRQQGGVSEVLLFLAASHLSHH